MAYIGNTPADKFLTLAKQNFSTSATTSYTLDSAVSSTQDIGLFINNVRQSPVDAYTVSGTALTLTSATAGTDEMYCVYLGKTVGTVSPASDSVTTAMLQANAVTGAKLNTDVISAQTALGATPADTDEFLISDAGVLKRVDYSHIKGGGKILQIGHVVSTTEVTNNSTSSYADGNLTLNFTPTSSSSTVLLILQLSIFLNHTTGADASTQVKIFRDTTEIYNGGSTQNYHSASSNGNVRYSTPLIYKDSPSTSSQVTYTYDFKNPHSTQVIEISDNSSPSTLTAFEIGA